MLKKILRQIPALIVLAALVAVGVNQFRVDGIPLIGDWSAEARFADAAGESPIITLEQAEQLFKRDGARFVDARPHDQFVEGHIQGALSLPWQEVDAHIVERFDRLAEAETSIAYAVSTFIAAAFQPKVPATRPVCYERRCGICSLWPFRSA